MLSEMSHKRTNTVWFPLYEAPRVVRFIDTAEWWLPRDGGRLSFLSFGPVKEKTFSVTFLCPTV